MPTFFGKKKDEKKKEFELDQVSSSLTSEDFTPEDAKRMKEITPLHKAGMKKMQEITAQSSNPDYQHVRDAYFKKDYREFLKLSDEYDSLIVKKRQHEAEEPPKEQSGCTIS